MEQDTQIDVPVLEMLRKWLGEDDEAGAVVEHVSNPTRSGLGTGFSMPINGPQVNHPKVYIYIYKYAIHGVFGIDMRLEMVYDLSPRHAGFDCTGDDFVSHGVCRMN